MNRRRRLSQSVLLALLVLPLSGCFMLNPNIYYPKELGKNPQGIWFQEPMIGDSGAAKKAAEHCAKYGKQAVFQGRLAADNPYTVPVLAYNCE